VEFEPIRLLILVQRLRDYDALSRDIHPDDPRGLSRVTVTLCQGAVVGSALRPGEVRGRWCAPGVRSGTNGHERAREVLSGRREDS